MAMPEHHPDLWVEYKKHRSPQAREDLIMRYAPLVKYVAGRLAVGLPPHVDPDDLYNWGILGLIDAVERFEPERGIKFETYALARIRGAMLDGLRSLDWIPHSLRRRAREVEEAYAAVEAELGRPGTDDEVAGYLGISREELDHLHLQMASFAMVSLDEVWVGNEDGSEPVHLMDTVEDTSSPDPVAVAEEHDLKRLLAEAIDTLPEKERLVVSLYYYEGLTGKEIAEVMGVSQSRISQLHSKAITRLRGKLTKHKEVYA